MNGTKETDFKRRMMMTIEEYKSRQSSGSSL